MTRNIANMDMSAFDWKQFWQSGALLRTSVNEVRVFCGPFNSSTDREGDLGPTEFFSNAQKWLKAEQSFTLKIEEFRTLLESQLGPRSLQRTDFEMPDLKAFEESFRLIQGKIQRGEIEKAVPMLKMQASKRPKPADLADSLFNLLKLPLSLYVYGFWHNGEGVLGATPEILFSLKTETLQSMALAGSAPKSESATRLPLLKDPKEMKEHQLVVDDLAARLRSLGWMRKENTRVLELPTLFHLLTPFEVNAVKKPPQDLIRHLHPTPALGVAPRAYGYQWMQELPEQKERGQYGAPLAFRLSSDEYLVLVCIRSLFWTAKTSMVFAGCGLVADSVLEREFGEVGAKMESIFQMLGME